MIFPGAGDEAISEYKSVIYYQVKQPRWFETLKVLCFSGHFSSPPGGDCKILPQVHKATLFKVVKVGSSSNRFILISFKCKDRTWMEMHCHILRIAIVSVPLVLRYAWPAASVPNGQKR